MVTLESLGETIIKLLCKAVEVLFTPMESGWACWHTGKNLVAASTGYGFSRLNFDFHLS